MEIVVERVRHIIEIYICYLPGGRSVWEKTVPSVLGTAALKTPGTVFPIRTSRPANNIYIFPFMRNGFKFLNQVESKTSQFEIVFKSLVRFSTKFRVKES